MIPPEWQFRGAWLLSLADLCLSQKSLCALGWWHLSQCFMASWKSALTPWEPQQMGKELLPQSC